jgi:hypothetical protein
LTRHDPVYRETVTVTPPAGGVAGAGLHSTRSLDADALREFGGHIADDPLRLVHSLPGVAAADDFRAEYSVRGSRYRHAGLVVDGIVAPWLQHAAPGRGHTGTLTMLRGDVVSDATLLVGAYPRHDAAQVGPQLSLSLREGSRIAPRWRFGISGTASTLTAEGPLGTAKRGSWLVGVRKSHVEWPIGRSDHDATIFGYADVQSKVVYDVRTGQQVGLSVVAGLSNVERDDPAPLAPGDGLNRAVLAGFSWRSTIGSRAVLTQRVSFVAHEFFDRQQAARPSNHGGNGAQAYRADVGAALFGGAIEAGAQVRRVQESRQQGATDAGAAWQERSGYASFRRALPGAVVVSGGARLADSTFLRPRVLDRWLQADWAAGAGWLLHGSTGVAHQFLTMDEGVLPSSGVVDLEPARATYVDVGVGRRVSPAFRWDVTVYARRERDRIDGVARGVEVTFEGRTRRGFSGWAAYAYGVARYTDAERRETFPADFDQRHAINVSGSTPLPLRARAGVTFRGGSNFPIPGYFTVRDGLVVPGERRNEAWLPAYARLDARIERPFVRAARRFTVFGEVLNVLNRANAGLAAGSLAGSTGEAAGLVERLYPRLLTAGLRIEF